MSRSLRAALAVLIVGLTATALLLGRWQLRRLAERRQANATLRAAEALPPLEVVASGASPTPGRRVLARGRFDPENQLLLRGRVHDAAPGLEVVTAFRLTGGETVLWVLRGFVTSPDATTIPPVPPPMGGELTITGHALSIPVTADGGQPLVRGRDTTWRRLDRVTLAQRAPRGFESYLILAGDSSGPGRIATISRPVVNDGPHLSYAIQWFGIALAIAAFGVIALRRGGRASARHRAAP